jgi:hypothetical protein
MPEAVKGSDSARPPRVTRSSGGQRHPLENALTAFVFVVGIVAFAIGFIVRAHVFGTALGIVAFVLGMYAQMISSTREQRIFIIAGVIGGFVALGLSIAHGGFG